MTAREWFRERTGIPRWVGVLVVVMALASTGQTAWYSWEQQKCNEAFADNLAARSRWADQDRTAMQTFWASVYAHPQAEERNLVLFREWVQTFERNNERRAATPLPDLASCD